MKRVTDDSLTTSHPCSTGVFAEPPLPPELTQSHASAVLSWPGLSAANVTKALRLSPSRVCLPSRPIRVKLPDGSEVLRRYKNPTWILDSVGDAKSTVDALTHAATVIERVHPALTRRQCAIQLKRPVRILIHEAKIDFWGLESLHTKYITMLAEIGAELCWTYQVMQDVYEDER